MTSTSPTTWRGSRWTYGAHRRALDGPWHSSRDGASFDLRVRRDHRRRDDRRRARGSPCGAAHFLCVRGLGRDVLPDGRLVNSPHTPRVPIGARVLPRTGGPLARTLADVAAAAVDRRIP